MDTQGAAAAADHKKMPAGTGALQFIQLFSTMSFAVLYSTLVLYATKGLGLSDHISTSLTAMLFAFNYASHLLGGFLGGRLFSYRSLFSIGMLLITAGCVFIAVPTLSSFYIGAALFLTGSGLNVTCINCMVMQLFHADDKRRETAFLWNYSMMNVGFFIGFAVAGYFQLQNNYHDLFMLSGVANVVALALTLLNWRTLRDIQTSFENQPQRRLRNNTLGALCIALLFVALYWLVQHPVLSEKVVIYGAAIMLCVVGMMAASEKDRTAQLKMWAYLVFAVMAIIFWTLYQLTPDGLTLFIERNVSRQFAGLTTPPQWFQNINPVVIMFGGPLLGYLFQRLRRSGYSISLTLQFGSALVLIGVAIAILPIGIALADPKGYSDPIWVIWTNVLLSFGELFIGPIGYAMVGQLAPERLRGILMGTRMMTSGAGVALAGMFSQMATESVGTATDPLITNSAYGHVFNLLGWSSVVGGIIIFLLYPLLRKLIQEKPYTPGLMG